VKHTLGVMENSALQQFDGQLMDGLQFCAHTYILFEAVCREPNGREQIRMRSSKVAKLLLGELLPICRYVQTCYRLGRYISVRWIDGSQSYDAELQQHGALVDQGFFPSVAYLEATCAMHENEHWVRYLMSQGQPTFAPEGISTSRGMPPKSRPVAFNNDEHVRNFAQILVGLIEKKASIPYPTDTSLVVQCYLNSLYTPEDWQLLMSKVEGDIGVLPFKEVILFDSIAERTSQMILRRRNDA